MERVVWGILVSFIITVSVGVYIVWLNIENNSKVHQEQRESIAENRVQLELIRDLLSKMQQQQEAIADDRIKQQQNRKSIDDLSQLLSELKSELSTQREEAHKNRNETFKSMEQLESDHKQMRSILNIHPGSYRSCKDVQTKASGMYNIRGKDIFDTFVASCEQDKHDGGWMVIQHRFNGALSFDRNWTDYRNGFGEVDGEHWLGLENIHQFTKEHDCELLVEVKDFFNNSKYARYDSFGIGSEAEQYRLTTLGTHTGTAEDSLQFHKRMKFSTPDRDNDNKDNGNCAALFNGGWWFDKCYNAHLNGLYRNANGINEPKIAWNSFNTDQRGLSYSRMLIRPLN